jgi:hypothetical protein
MGERGGEGEHEASRRMKTELLVQLDGLARRGDERVFVLVSGGWTHALSMHAGRGCLIGMLFSQPPLCSTPKTTQAATNLPWELDTVRHRMACRCLNVA